MVFMGRRTKSYMGNINEGSEFWRNVKLGELRFMIFLLVIMQSSSLTHYPEFVLPLTHNRGTDRFICFLRSRWHPCWTTGGLPDGEAWHGWAYLNVFKECTVKRTELVSWCSNRALFVAINDWHGSWLCCNRCGAYWQTNNKMKMDNLIRGRVT